MPKIVYILPLYDERTDTHLFYNYELLRALYGKLELFVVIERASGEIHLPHPFLVQRFEKGIARFFELLSLIVSLRRRGYADFYIHYSLYGAMAAWVVRVLWGGRVWYWHRGMPWLFKRGFFEERLLRFALRHSILVTGPESLAKEYKRRYRVREYKILSNWIDVERFRPRESKEAAKRWFGLDSETEVILFVHHLSQRKGADLLNQIASGFEAERIAFFVIGEGPYAAKLEEEASLSKVPIKLLGAIPNQDLPLYFQAARVFLMPSREEGSPHVILEAEAAGTPVVASSIGGVREVLAPGAEEFLCPAGDVTCFQEKIKNLLRDAGRYETLRQAGMSFAANFSKARGVEEFSALFSTPHG